MSEFRVDEGIEASASSTASGEVEALSAANVAANAFIGFQATIAAIELPFIELSNNVNKLRSDMLLLKTRIYNLERERGVRTWGTADNGSFQTPPRKTPNGTSISED
jgi:hypothetical protein